MTYTNPIKHPNNTISGGDIVHVAQLYFDQALIDTVEKVAPYNKNTAPHVKNSFDFLLATGAQNGQDPLVEYVMLGPSIEDGILAWLNFGIDPKASYTTSPATLCDSGGCKNNPLGGFGAIFNGAGSLPLPGLGKGGIGDLLGGLFGAFAKGGAGGAP
jgi:hypothetical protein